MNEIFIPLQENELFAIDLHGHLGQWFNFSIPGRNPDDLLDAMDRYGIRKMVLSHLKSITGNFVDGNREAMEFAARHPKRLAAYIGVDPHYKAEALEQLTLWARHPCAVGVKLHPETHQYDILNSELCGPVFRFANNHHMPVLIHVWGSAAAIACAQVAQEYPDLTLLMGHSGGPQAYKEAVWAAKQAKNILLDLTGSAAPQGLLEWMVEQVGAERIVFGSDMPFIDAKHTLGRVVYSGLTKAQKHSILAGNALRLLNKEG